MSVELGFVETPEGSLTADKFPSKVGGIPAWLNPEFILPVEKVRCGVCDKPMILLLQLYTPEDEPPEAFHRMVYIFICSVGICHKTNWQKRSQLPKDNLYWPLSNSSEVDDSNQPITTYHAARQCVVCGLHGSKTCGKCKAVYYCSREHQTSHWTIGQHKLHCGATDLSAEEIANGIQLCRNAVLFPEYEIVTESESLSDSEEQDTLAESSSLNNSQALVPVGDEVYENSNVDVDKAFLKFQKRISFQPDQVVRYARLEYDTDTDPLWISDYGKPTDNDLPPCEHCGQQRTFEFQILSTLLNHLKIDNTRTDSLDWGSLLVYT
ncbi:6565_t:CDS:2, partial [Paraglomus occultum]